MRVLWLLFLPSIAAFAAPALAATSDVGSELIVNGDFSASRDGQYPDGYLGARTGVHYLVEDGQHYLRLGPLEGPVAASVGQNPKLDPDWFKLKVSIRVRARDVVLGTEGWHDARVAMAFFDAAGTQVGGWPDVLQWTGSTDGWQTFSRQYVIPQGAVELRITPALFYAKGTVDYADFSVKVVKVRSIKVADAVLPAGVSADWSLAGAQREELPGRGRVCLNGLWRFQPGASATRPADGTGWGYLKVPAAWPGKSIECVQPFGADIWDVNVDWTKVDEGWYERDVTVPAEWARRRLFVDFDLPQTEAEVWVGGRRLGAARFPAGRVDVTSDLTPGTTTRLSVHVKSAALKPDGPFRGLVGDVFLTAEPTGARLTSLQTRPSVRTHALGLAMGLDAPAGSRYHLEAVANKDGREAWRGKSEVFAAAAQVVVNLPWAHPELWDFGQPNLYDLRVNLIDEATSQAVDAMTTRFGFRELWLDGKDIMLNGTPVHWRALFFDGVTRNDGAASAAAVRRWLQRARDLGFNFIILSNYDLAPGQTTAFGEVLETCDAMGFALSFSLPQALWHNGAQPDDAWKQIATYAVATVGNHPSVLAYAGDHNRLGYTGDQNPEKLDGNHPPKPPASRASAIRDRKVGADEEAFVRALDPTRELYHHESGTMGAWHTVNCYLDWSPVQERSEWLSAWSKNAVKPLFFVEWGPPHEASWGGHRQGPFIWTNKVNSEPLGIEYGAMLFGDAAYRPDAAMERYVDTYERVYARRQPFYISEVLSTCWDVHNELNNVDLKTIYTDTVWPRFRTAGISAILPWDQAHVGYAVGYADATPDLPTDWSKLQRPGRAPDFERPNGDYWATPETKVELTSWGGSFQRWNQPLLAYLAGAPERFTERGHNVSAGETITKQVILVNDSRAAVEAPYRWHLVADGRTLETGRGRLKATAGGQDRQPISVPIPSANELTLSVDVDLPGGMQHDSLTLHVISEPSLYQGLQMSVALFDPRGLTKLTAQHKVVDATTSLDGIGALVIGREAIGLDNPLPDVTQLLARGGKVLVMEQTEAALTRRLGFRCNDPSLRNVFVRVADHPVLRGLDTPRLADWRGQATLIPAKMDLPMDWEPGDPPKDWLGFRNTRVWKWGNEGQVASVVIEKPQKGDWTALVDGGFDLQYAPLLLGKVGGGEVLFCQMDVTGRTAPDPAAQRLMANLLEWCAVPRPAVANAGPPCAYVGGDDGAKLLGDLGAQFQRADAGHLPHAGTLVIGPNAGPTLAGAKAELDAAVGAGLTVVVLEHDAAHLAGWLPIAVQTKQDARTVSPLPAGRWFTGLGVGDLRWRGRKSVTLVGADAAEPNVLAAVPHGQGAFVFCQILPGDFDYKDEYRVYLKRTANRCAVMLSRLLSNCGVPLTTPLPEFWSKPAVGPGAGRWLESYYLDTPAQLDDPYRYNRW